MGKFIAFLGVVVMLSTCGVAFGGSSVEGMMAIPENTFRGLSMAPDGESLVVFDRYGSVYHVSLVGSMSIRNLEGWALCDGLLGPTFLSSGELIAFERNSSFAVRNLQGKTLTTIPSKETFPHIGVLPGGNLLIQRKDDLRFLELNKQEGKLDARFTVPIAIHEFCVVTEALSPNGKLLLVIGRDLRNRGDESLMRVWDIAANREIWSEPFKIQKIQKRIWEPVTAGFLSDTRAFVASHRLQIIDLEKQAVLQMFPEDASQTSFMSASSHALSSDQSLLAIGSRNEVIVWDAIGGTEVARLPVRLGDFIRVGFLKDLDRLAALGLSGLQIWDFRKKQMIREWSLKDFKPSKKD